MSGTFSFVTILPFGMRVNVSSIGLIWANSRLNVVVDSLHRSDEKRVVEYCIESNHF